MADTPIEERIAVREWEWLPIYESLSHKDDGSELERHELAAEHNAVVRELRAALSEVARLREALRHAKQHVVDIDNGIELTSKEHDARFEKLMAEITEALAPKEPTHAPDCAWDRTRPTWRKNCTCGAWKL